MRPFDLSELVAVLLLAGFLALASGAPLITSMAVSPGAIESGEVCLTSTCPHKLHTGSGCLTCGMTRGFTAASRGRFRQAWEYNRGTLPLYGSAWLVFLGSGGAMTFSVAHLWRRRRAAGR